MIFLSSYVGVALLIFGGCCSNVCTLESLLRVDQSSGLLITFVQYTVVILAIFPFQLRFFPQLSRAGTGAAETAKKNKTDAGTFLGILRRPTAPARRWAVSAFLFMLVNALNNWAFSFNISVPGHILLRSFGTVISMFVGWTRNRRYSRVQVLSVLILSAGVVLTAWEDSTKDKKAIQTEHLVHPGNDDGLSSPLQPAIGLLILLTAQFVAAYMGIYSQETFELYGKNWLDAMFYTHLFSFPFLFLFSPQITSSFKAFERSPPLGKLPHDSILHSLIVKRVGSFTSFLKHGFYEPRYPTLAAVPSAVFFLLLNGVTQLVCITGVNILSANSTAVTISIILNIRKLVSFLLSVVLFDNKLNPPMVLGASLVFFGAALYAWEKSYAKSESAQVSAGTPAKADAIKQE